MQTIILRTLAVHLFRSQSVEGRMVGWGWSLSLLFLVPWSSSRSEAAVGFSCAVAAKPLSMSQLNHGHGSWDPGIPWRLQSLSQWERTPQLWEPKLPGEKSLPDIREPTLTSLKTQYFLIVSSSYALGLIFLLKIVISTERWPAYLSAISGVGSEMEKAWKIAQMHILAKKNSTKNAYFATYCNSRQNSVYFPESNQVAKYSFIYLINYLKIIIADKHITLWHRLCTSEAEFLLLAVCLYTMHIRRRMEERALALWASW